MARFRDIDHQSVSTAVFQRDGLHIERVQRFDHTALLAETSRWPVWRMRITLGGTRYLSYAGQRHTLSPNTVCWCGPLPELVRTSWLPGTGSDVVDISWSHGRWRRFCEEQKAFTQQNCMFLGEGRQPHFALLPAPPQLLHIVRQLLKLAQKTDVPMHVLENQCWLLESLLAALRFTQRALPADDVGRKRVDQAQALMVQHLDAPLNILQIAAQLNVSPRQLQRDFSTCTGLTPIRYFNLMRLSEANFLLAETSLPVAEIAKTLGYTSAAHFSTAFRQVYHCSPRDARRESVDW